MENPRSTAGDIVSIGTRHSWKPDFKALASQRLRQAREALGLDQPAFTTLMNGSVTGWSLNETALTRMERGTVAPPGDLLLAAVAAESGTLIAPPGALFDAVPHSFPASALNGMWVTAYEFRHGGEIMHHADIAHVTADGGRRLRIVNNPPEPRTEGRTRGFGNEIDAVLAGRHVVGQWKNTTDARYFGSVQLGVEPGENVMDGYYTGLASDVAVSVARWRWIRLYVPPGVALSQVMLRNPVEVHAVVMNHSFDAPISLDGVIEAGEER